MLVWGRKAGLAAIGAALTVQPLMAQTLSDAMAMAYRTSGLIEQNRAVLRAADEDVAQAVAALRPVVNYALGANYSDRMRNDRTSLAASLSVGLELYDANRRQLGVDAAKETVLATRAALVDVENSVLLNAVTAYLGVRRSEAFVELRKNNVRLLTEHLRATQDRFEVGELSRTDVSVAEARLAAARSGLAVEEGSLARAREQYRATIGSYPETLLPPPDPPNVPDSEDEARAMARQHNPQLRQVQHQAKAVEIGVERAARRRLPAISGTAGMEFNDDGEGTASVGIQLSGPIYQGGAIPSVMRKAQAQRDQVRAQLHTTGFIVDQQVSNAYSSLAVAEAGIEASEQQVSAAQLALQGVREEFRLGARASLEVLDQEQELLDAQTNRVSVEIDRHIAAYQVLDAIGVLTAESLGLDVPIHDPEAYYDAVKDAPARYASPQGEKLDRVLRAVGQE
ncbi:MAG: TolC family outer membrane protein [Boseongicola sp.]|nr:TolC family outer membrane protein [Boseongicola sp.]MYH58365.1 TolC family outer membrane protein [Boseongicola sp. SB0675_bin_26]